MTEETPTPTSSPASDFQPEPEAASVPQPEPEPTPWPEPEAVAEPIVQAEPEAASAAQPEPEPAPWPEPEAATTAELPPPPGPEVEPASDEFAEALEEFERSAAPAAAASRAARGVKVGAKVKGKVVSVDEHQTLIDFGGRSEAVAEIGQFRNEDGTLRIAVGDVLDLFVVKTGEQVVLAASLRVDSHGALAKVREARAAGVPVNGKVVAVNSGGLAVNIGGVRAFCPMSQIELGFCADPSVYVGRTLEFLVTEMKEGRGGVVLSRRQVLRRVEGERAKVLLATLKVGDELEGTVTRLEAFGVFVDLGGIDGLVHVTELRHERTNHPKEVVHSGEKVHVRVLKLEPTKEGRPPRIALSIKAATPDP
jgi:small subunit ribosomal protein S1